MGMSLQLRESLQELLYTDKYDTDDAELIVQRRFEKKEPFALNPRIENPLFSKILHLMHVDIDFAELRDCYFSADMGDGLVLVYPYKDTEYFLAIDLHRDRLEETDAVTFAVYCDARKYVKLKEYFELLWINSALDYKMPITEAPLIKSVLSRTGSVSTTRATGYPSPIRNLWKAYAADPIRSSPKRPCGNALKGESFDEALQFAYS